MSQQLPPQRPQVVYMQSQPNKGLAALLSLIIPGAGQMYRGHVIRGLMWLGMILLCYAFAWIFFIGLFGLFLHFMCVVFAAL